MSTHNIQYEEKIIAFLDILGFKELVFQNRKNAINLILDDRLEDTLRGLSDDVIQDVVVIA